MSKQYQVLALKYRPHNFEELVGQQHTVKTLVNALNNNNLHNGFLFTGTRGVGKTTIARIFAKSINCEKGVSANPCGKCTTCIEIKKGQSIDLIEIDAASYTGVDNMREILENAQYMPSKNRFKIYLIDEVHMLSKSSFNALLKTLEEPPEHIKFLLATTDPQKLPITILSRCLQFNLNKLTLKEIITHLKFIMDSEGLNYEESALAKIADFGNGSMRDALSLLDQSISYGNGSVLDKDIKDMLCLVQHDDIIYLAKLVIERKTSAIINFVKDLAHKGENLSNALNDLTSLIHQIAIAQILPNSPDIKEEIHTLANKISVHDLQLYYQIAVNGKKDLSHSPSEQIGLEMTLLRMIAFHSEYSAEKKTLKIKKPVANNYKKSAIKDSAESTDKKTNAKPEEAKNTSSSSISISNQKDWESVIKKLPFKGAAKMLVKNTLFYAFNNNKLKLTLDANFSNLLTKNTQKAIENNLLDVFDEISVVIETGQTNNNSLAQKEGVIKKAQQQQLEQKYLGDEALQELEKTFQSKVNIKSIKNLKDI